MTKQTPLARILSYADKTPGFGRDGDCWKWTGATEPKAGYGITWLYGKKLPAHRAVFMLISGLVILDRWTLVLHSCDNPTCINPAHLSAGTAQQNMDERSERGRHKSGNTNKTACQNGHPFTPENTYINATSGSRVCRACYSAYQKAYKQRNKAGI